MRLALALAFAALLAACAPLSEAPPDRRAPVLGPLPAMKSFGATRVTPPIRPNAEIARDFIDLTFRMENGRELPILTRFETPIRVGLRGSVPASARPDLDRLLARLRAEAGIDIARAGAGEPANLMLEFLPQAVMRRAVPLAACFVVPRDENFAEFRRRRSGASDWAGLTRREAVTVFLPSDAAPQEIRDCLHEEVAQAIGPLNDLYRLPDSVFNDDNFNTVLTGFDMLVLRATYSPELASGMRADEVMQRLPGLLSRLNPRGRGGGGGPPAYESRAWIDAIENALTPRFSPAQRRDSAARALAIARNAGWQDPRLAFSYFTLGRMALAREFELAAASYIEAAMLYDRPGTEIQAAHVAMQLAAFALTAGRAEAAIALADRNAPVALAAENAALLATFLMVKAEALEMLGRDREAQAVRLDSLGWARYGFGSDADVRRRAAEIAALRPRPAAAGGNGS